MLVAVVLEHLAGSSLAKWKTYAVLVNAGAAVAVGQLSLLLGLSVRSGQQAMWIAALGWGSMYTLFDCYTSDPLMYLLGPVLSILLLRGHRFRAGAIGSVMVFAKEFAAIPLWIFTMAAALKRRWTEALETLLAAMTATLVWFGSQTFFMAIYNYSYAKSKSADVLHGGYLSLWLSSVGTLGAVKYLFTTFSALYVLFPVGFVRAPRELRLIALASIPAVAALIYVQQPERALWNFHFIVIPVAAIALSPLPAWASWFFVLCFGITNLRFGAQLQTGSIGRVAFVASIAVAFAALLIDHRRRQSI